MNASSAAGLAKQPIGQEVQPFGPVSGLEQMIKAVAAVRPIDEADALLEGGRGLSKQQPLVDLETAEGVTDAWERAFAHPDRADAG